MDIKKIILEEVDAFDWAKDVPEASQPVTPENVYVGMRVRISENSEFHEDGEYGDEANPIDVTGTVDTLDDHGLYIMVVWDNGESNSYSHKDLVTHPYKIYLYMNIRKIIQEEMDNSFDWVDDILPSLPNEWGAEYSVVTTDVERLINHFNNQGFKWMNDGGNLLDDGVFIQKLINMGSLRFYVSGRIHIHGYDKPENNSHPDRKSVTV